MGVTVGRSPIIMDAQGDLLSDYFQGRDMNAPTPGIPKLKITSFRFVCQGNSGECVLKSGNGVNDTIIWQSAMLSPGEIDESAFGDGYWIGNVYVDTLPAGGRVYLHYE